VLFSLLQAKLFLYGLDKTFFKVGVVHRQNRKAVTEVHLEVAPLAGSKVQPCFSNHFEFFAVHE